MTIQTPRPLADALENFKRCAEEAPEGTYEGAKRIEGIIGAAVDALMVELRSHGFKADACDAAFDLEAAMYDYVRGSNPDSPVFPTAEGFGAAMRGPAAERVRFQAERDRDALRALRADD